jgi:hypothetical protein
MEIDDKMSKKKIRRVRDNVYLKTLTTNIIGVGLAEQFCVD